MIVYIETNFLMGAAMGRDDRWEALFDLPVERARVVMPSICLMEALSAFEDEQKRRNRFGNQIDEQLTQLRRDLTSFHATALLHALEQARVHNQNLANDIERRLMTVIERLTVRAELLPLNPATCLAGIRSALIDEPTDSFILATILEHAASCADERKCLLTANTKDFDADLARAAIAAAEIKFFARTTNLLGWLASQATR